MSSCGISDIPRTFFFHMTNLYVLDISSNGLKILKTEMFIGQTRLRTLKLDGNLDIHTIESNAFVGLTSVRYIQLTHAIIKKVSSNAFSGLKLHILDLSNNEIDTIEKYAFQYSVVDKVYLNSTNIHHFDKFLFDGFDMLDILVTNAYRFCCVIPPCFPEDQCYPHKDEFSSCSDLMRNEVLVFLMRIIAFLSLVGNILSLLYRVFRDRSKLKLGYGIFVSNLAVADFLMGVYLVIISIADDVFRGEYIFYDETWRHSVWCTMAGVISTISSEASVFFVCLITVDRLLVIKYPFGQFRFAVSSSLIVSVFVWMISLLLALLPVLYTSYFKGSFYSKSGVCLALPLTRDRPSGWLYSIIIFIVFNFFTFVLIAVGQWLIYFEIKQTKSSLATMRGRSNDLRVARNLLFVVATDFLCWVPIGILGNLNESALKILVRIPLAKISLSYYVTLGSEISPCI